MIRDVDFCRIPCFAAALLVLAVLAATGCSGEPSAATTAAEQMFCQDELKAMRQSVKSPSEFHKLRKIKAAERDGTAVVKTKTSAGKTKRN